MLVLLWFCNLLESCSTKHKNRYKLAEASKRLQNRKKCLLLINILSAIVVIAFACHRSNNPTCTSSIVGTFGPRSRSSSTFLAPGIKVVATFVCFSYMYANGSMCMCVGECVLAILSRSSISNKLVVDNNSSSKSE